MTLGGRQVELPRLRVRSSDGEVPLASFQWAAATDPLDEHTLAAVAAGVSTRRYAGTLDPVPADVTERATSSSAVSRRFVALSTKRLQAFLSRPLGELDLRAVCIDGKVFRDHCMVIALGIDTQGRKHVLGLREGATETAGGRGSDNRQLRRLEARPPRPQPRPPGQHRAGPVRPRGVGPAGAGLPARVRSSRRRSQRRRRRRSHRPPLEVRPDRGACGSSFPAARKDRDNVELLCETPSPHDVR